MTMPYESRIILVSDEPDTTAAVARALQQNGRFSAETHCPQLVELPERLEAFSDAAVLVDLCPDPVARLHQIEPIARRFPGAVFICLSSSPLESDALLAAMQAGVRHVLLKGDIAAELHNSLRRFLPEDGGMTRVPAAARGRRSDRPPGETFDDRAGAADNDEESDRREAAARLLRSRCVVVMSAAGGVGATTIAINLAFEAFVEGGRKALVVDLDDHYGAVGTYLGLEGQFSIADILAKGDRLDAELVGTTALAYGEGLDAIISPASATARPDPIMSAARSAPGAASTPHQPQRSPASPTAAGPRGAHGRYGTQDDPFQTSSGLASTLSRLPGACRGAYAFSVIDAPPRSGLVSAGALTTVPGAEPQLALARAADAVLVVFQLNVKDIRTARRMIGELKAGGVDPGRIMAVANRWCRAGLLGGGRDRYSMISPEEASTALGGMEVIRLSNDYKSAIQSINFGQPLPESAPRSALRKDLRELALRLMPSAIRRNREESRSHRTA